MSVPEDAASVLEQFVHDVANTPAEITHLLEEIQAKDLQIAAFKDEITKRDAQLQKWVRMNGGHVHNPKDDAFSKTINDCYDKCEILQAEKCGLSEKALMVLERQIKRLDVGLRSLSAREEFPSDWGGPSLLTGSASATGVSTPVGGGGAAAGHVPLQVVSGNIGSVGGAPNIANAAQIRMAQSGGVGGSGGGGGGGGAGGGAGRAGSGQQTPTINLSRSQREGSSEANKRRRLNASLGSLPTSSSNLRQSSLGPGTPKAGTPGPSGVSTSRAGSAQPARPAAAAAGQKKGPTTAPSQQSTSTTNNKKLAPHQAASANRKRNRTKHGGGGGGGDRRRQLARDRDRTTPSTNASLSDNSSSTSTSPTPSSLPRNQGDGAHDASSSSRNRTSAATSKNNHNNSNEADEDEENDDQLYCYCQKVSFGDMVGCDNDNCSFQWFHWECVGLKSEPEGEWLCPTCRKLPKGQLAISRG